MINRILFKAVGGGGGASYIRGDVYRMYFFFWLEGRVTRGPYWRMAGAGVISSNLRSTIERH